MAQGEPIMCAREMGRVHSGRDDPNPIRRYAIVMRKYSCERLRETYNYLRAAINSALNRKFDLIEMRTRRGKRAFRCPGSVEVHDQRLLAKWPEHRQESVQGEVHVDHIHELPQTPGIK